MMDIQGKKVLVVGLARTGLASARCLCRRGAIVTVTDLRPPQFFAKEIPQLLDLKIGMELGVHRPETFLRHDLIVVSPGVPVDLPELKRARQEGIPVVPEIEVASWFLTRRLVGITGTNGKTTTTALLGNILEASGLSAFVGGNIGVPLLSALDLDPPPTVIVSELSSFQLETIRSFRPHVAALLNLSPNHLDRHPNFESYVAAKARIFQNQTEDDYAILNADDPHVMKLAAGLRSTKVYFSRQRELSRGVFVSGGKIYYRIRSLEVPLMDVRDVLLRGDFNLENVLAAAAAACVVGAAFAAVRRAVREFQGVEHRLEFVRAIQGVEFYNDSKATSVDAAAKALSTFEGGVHLILGGKDKGAPYGPLRRLLKERAKEVLVIGAARERIRKELMGTVEIVDAGDLEIAVQRAFQHAEEGDTILLAPACSSFDQFQNFEHRGRVFKALVESLAGGKAWEARNPSIGTEARADANRISIASPDAFVPASDESQLSAAGSPEQDPQGTAREPVERVAFRLSSPRELEYVYEVSAEEAAPGSSLDFEQGIDEPAFDPEDLAPLEDVEDEVLAFEVRSSPGGKSAPGKRSHRSVRGGAGKRSPSGRK